MKLSTEDVRQILSIVEASSFDAIEIKVGDVTLAASKSGALRSVDRATVSATEPSQAPAPSPTAGPADEPAPKAASEPADGLVQITSPLVGLYYLSPEPGAEPFVREGDRIAEGSTVGIIEVMKVFTNIRVEQSGTIVKCLVADNELVELGQPLFLLRPEA